eukprot:1138374-Pelagomonas_calceolata.AAC.5
MRRSFNWALARFRLQALMSTLQANIMGLGCFDNIHDTQNAQSCVPKVVQQHWAALARNSYCDIMQCAGYLFPVMSVQASTPIKGLTHHAASKLRSRSCWACCLARFHGDRPMTCLL